MIISSVSSYCLTPKKLVPLYLELVNILHFQIWIFLAPQLLKQNPHQVLFQQLAQLLPHYHPSALMHLHLQIILPLLLTQMNISVPQKDLKLRGKNISNACKEIRKIFVVLQTIIARQAHQDKEHDILQDWMATQFAPNLGLELPLPNPSPTFVDLLKQSISWAPPYPCPFKTFAFSPTFFYMSNGDDELLDLHVSEVFLILLYTSVFFFNHMYEQPFSINEKLYFGSKIIT